MLPLVAIPLIPAGSNYSYFVMNCMMSVTCFRFAIHLYCVVYLTKSAAQGSQTQTFLAASNKLTSADSGKYFDNSQVAKLGDAAMIDSDAEWLWEKSEELTGKKFSV